MDSINTDITRDNLFGTYMPIMLDSATLESGQNLSKGSVLGKLTKDTVAIAADEGNIGDGEIASATVGRLTMLGAYVVKCTEIDIEPQTPVTAVADGRNTGNGTCSSVVVGSTAKVGTHRAICRAAASDSGTFIVLDPDGIEIGEATVGSEFATGGLTFTISDGATDFAVGDTFYMPVTGSGLSKWSVTDPYGNVIGYAYEATEFDSEHLDFTITTPTGTAWAVDDEITITVSASGKMKLLNSASIDGSQDFYAILAEDCDATSADKTCLIAVAGSFQSQALTLGGSTTVASIKDAARDRGCYIQTSISDNNVVGG